MSQQNRFPVREKNVLDNRHLTLSTPCPSAKGKWSSMAWGMRKNKVACIVYTNDPEDSRNDNGRIQVELKPATFFSFIYKLGQVATGPADVKFRLGVSDFIFPGGKRSERPVEIADLWVGKDKDGVVWVSLTAKDRPRIKFNLIDEQFEHWYHGDGEKFTKAEASELSAKGYIKALEELVPLVLAINYKHPEPKGQQGGGYGGGQQGGGRREESGGGNRGGDSYDEDIPF